MCFNCYPSVFLFQLHCGPYWSRLGNGGHRGELCFFHFSNFLLSTTTRVQHRANTSLVVFKVLLAEANKYKEGAESSKVEWPWEMDEHCDANTTRMQKCSILVSWSKFTVVGHAHTSEQRFYWSVYGPIKWRWLRMLTNFLCTWAFDRISWYGHMARRVAVAHNDELHEEEWATPTQASRQLIWEWAQEAVIAVLLGTTKKTSSELHIVFPM